MEKTLEEPDNTDYNDSDYFPDSGSTSELEEDRELVLFPKMPQVHLRHPSFSSGDEVAQKKQQQQHVQVRRERQRHTSDRSNSSTPKKKKKKS